MVVMSASSRDPFSLDTLIRSTDRLKTSSAKMEERLAYLQQRCRQRGEVLQSICDEQRQLLESRRSLLASINRLHQDTVGKLAKEQQRTAVTLARLERMLAYWESQRQSRS